MRKMKSENINVCDAVELACNISGVTGTIPVTTKDIFYINPVLINHSVINPFTKITKSNLKEAQQFINNKILFPHTAFLECKIINPINGLPFTYYFLITTLNDNWFPIYVFLRDVNNQYVLKKSMVPSIQDDNFNNKNSSSSSGQNYK